MCKGTTKNAHTQAKRANIHKNDRFIYLIHYPSLAQARLKATCWRVDDKVATDFMTICERTGVWAALSERSYGGIGFDSDGILSGLIKAKADVRSTTTNYGFLTGSYYTFPISTMWLL